MAKSGPKKQLQENRSRLAFLRVLLIVTNVVFYFGRLIIFRTSNTTKLYAAALVMSGLQAFCYRAVSNMAEPLLGPNEEILDGGADISFAKIASYYQDVIYLCSFVQVACLLTDKAFWIFWLLPLAAGWIVYATFIQPLMAHNAASKEMPETEAERKRREKAEKKAGKPKFKPVR